MSDRAPVTRLLPDATRLGPVRLQVADLDRSLAYYGDLLGFRVLERTDGGAALGIEGSAEPLVVLEQRVGAIPVPPRGRLGLYHFAVLLPDRAALGRFLAHLAARGVRAGASDHSVSEALYLQDPDGLGIEVYADRPRESWTWDGAELSMSTLPLDGADVVRAAGGRAWTGMPPATRIGHVHLHVGDLDRAREFYRDTLGLDATVWSYPGALFLSAGGYHHHLGVNTWAVGAEPAGPEDARLLEWTIVLPSAEDAAVAAARLRDAGHRPVLDGDDWLVPDPWGTTLRLRAERR